MSKFLTSDDRLVLNRAARLLYEIAVEDSVFSVQFRVQYDGAVQLRAIMPNGREIWGVTADIFAITGQHPGEALAAQRNPEEPPKSDPK